MAVATVFMNNKSQAVRLPKDVAFPPSVRKVSVSTIGDIRVLTPVDDHDDGSWRHFFGVFPPDESFLADRHQGEAESRDW
ncbi:MAG: type II toxin-antitoxin system VapB family antitoxin [Propionibacteriaceae bacterium]|jgi:antitoxin VapB|nr:type II toxin-antitoxin system VapB family antitoxin [Propionibacteriaceae bacterium]